MKNIENKNFKDEKELAKNFDDQLKGLKEDILKEKKDIENIDRDDFKGELNSLKDSIGKNIEKSEINDIEKMLESSEETWNKGHVNKSKSGFKYKPDENREKEINQNIDKSAGSVDEYISKASGFLGNRMRKIMSTEK